MSDDLQYGAALKAEQDAIIRYLCHGPAELQAKAAAAFDLKRKNSPVLEVSAQALKLLARRGWVKRHGTQIEITEKASCENFGGLEHRASQDIELTENGQTQTVTRLVAESPIDYLASRKDKKGVPMLGQAEWSAGDRLRSDFTRANMLPGIGMRWGEPIRNSGGYGGAMNQTEAAIAARARVNKALNAVGPEFSGLLVDVCCFLKGLELVETERGWPQRSAKLMLRAGLSILARHYNPPSKTAAKTRVWSSTDNRPCL